MVSTGKFSNIIFDLGGVIINLDPQRTIDKFKAIGFTEIETFLDDCRSLGFLAEFQIGKISELQFCNEVRRYAKIDLTSSAIYEAWNAMLLDYPLNRIEKLKQLRQRYRIFLLSNTNIVHYQDFAFRVPGIENISQLFEQVYYSHTIGLSKPNRKAYEYVIMQSQLNPAETLFLDDLPENVEAARQVGMQVHQVVNANEWVNWF